MKQQNSSICERNRCYGIGYQVMYTKPILDTSLSYHHVLTPSPLHPFITPSHHHTLTPITQAEALKENSSSRVRLAVTVQAPLVLIPLSATSQSALVADLGQLKINNKFLLASDPGVGGAKPGVAPNAFLSSDGLPAIVDCMEVFISSIQLGRYVHLHDSHSTVSLE